MPLIKCPHCHRDVSDISSKCPFCHRQLTRYTSDSYYYTDRKVEEETSSDSYPSYDRAETNRPASDRSTPAQKTSDKKRTSIKGSGRPGRILPGFRSGNVLHMFIACIIYLSLTLDLLFVISNLPEYMNGSMKAFFLRAGLDSLILITLLLVFPALSKKRSGKRTANQKA